MSSKGPLPTLQGHRIKTRKRDEKEKFDPGAFRDSLLSGFSQILYPDSSPTGDQPVEEEVKNGTKVSITKEHLEALYKYLDTQGNGKIDYRKYGESLFDILIAGGILAPGGSIIVDPDATKHSKTDLCVFSASDPETLRGFFNVIVKLIRRYKYLEKTLEEEFKKIIKFLKGFSPEERDILARFTGLLIAGTQVPPVVLVSAIQDHFVKDGIASEFLVTVLQIWLAEKDAPTVWTSLKKGGLDQKIMEFLPASKRTPEYLATVFRDGGLNQLLEYQKAGLGDKAKREMQNNVALLIKEETTTKEIITAVKESVAKNNMQEHEVVVLLWNTVMNVIEWNKKEELVADQAIKHLKGYTQLFKTFASTPKAEMSLILRIQEYCYENMNFIKVFQKIVVLFYKSEF